MKIQNIVAFLALMGGDVWDKSPDYIMEKFNRYCLSEKEDEFMWGLDGDKKKIVEIWRKKWDEEYKHLKRLRK